MKRIMLPVLILAVGIGGFVYLKQTQPASEPIQTTERAWVVQVTSVQPTTLSPNLTLYGQVETPRHTTLRAPNSASSPTTEVIEVRGLEGQRVSQGELLARLNDRDIQLTVQQRQADIEDIKAQISLEKQINEENLTAIAHEEMLLKLAEKTFQRLQRLEQQQLTSSAALEEAQQAIERQQLTLTNRRSQIKNHPLRLAQLQARLNRAQALNAMAQLELERTQIKAPFAAMIAQVKVALGDRVRSGDEMISLYDMSALEVRAQIPTRYRSLVLNAFQRGAQLSAQAQVGSMEIPLQLERIAGQIDTHSGGIDGLFQVNGGADALRLGQFLTLVLKLPEQEQLVALPFEALYGTERIYKWVEGRMKAVTVERVGEQVTAEGESRVLIRSSALLPGDQVITRKCKI